MISKEEFKKLNKQEKSKYTKKEINIIFGYHPDSSIIDRQLDMLDSRPTIDETICYLCKHSSRPIAHCKKWVSEENQKGIKPIFIAFAEKMECQYYEKTDTPNVTDAMVKEASRKRLEAMSEEDRNEALGIKINPDSYY